MSGMNSSGRHTISRRRRVFLGGGTAVAVVALAVIAIELAARATRASHNRRVRHLGQKLQVSVSGSGDPVVFLHGFRGSGRYWEPHIRSLAASHQVIVVDLLGFGYSPWPADASYDIEEHLSAIHRTIQPIVGDRRITVVGHSMGAILASEYALRYRDRVSSLVVLNAPMFRSDAEAKARIREMSHMAAMFSVQRFWARASCDLVCAFRPLLFKIAPRLEPDVPPHVARDAVLHRWESFDRTLRNVVLQSRLEETLRSIASLPITIIHGTTDQITDRERLEATAAATGAKLVFVRGGHNIYLENPSETMRTLTAALDR
jgi:pimeloyl-ACP methyl ester carboxylesterase